MFPSLEAIREYCEVGAEEALLLASAQAPIVLLPRRSSYTHAFPSVAPDTYCLGAMLPYTPLHHLLLDALDSAVVATSGNRSGEPLCIDEHEALLRLAGIADCFLVHDRPIARPVDDSVLRVVLGRELMLRRARGYAPLPVRLPRPLPTLLAVGGHLKNTVALAIGQDVYLSQHVGDLDTVEADASMQKIAHDLIRLLSAKVAAIACDQHPDYRSTRFAAASPLSRFAVQHHHAHALACIAEMGLAGPVLAVVWDGAGLGPDGTLWGGEFLKVEGSRCERVAHLRCFPLPGGERALREPRCAGSAL